MKLREYRIVEKKMTQEQLGEKFGCSISAISKYENGTRIGIIEEYILKNNLPIDIVKPNEYIELRNEIRSLKMKQKIKMSNRIFTKKEKEKMFLKNFGLGNGDKIIFIETGIPYLIKELKKNYRLERIDGISGIDYGIEKMIHEDFEICVKEM